MGKKKSPVAEYLSAIGSKGGAAKVPKGLAVLTDEERATIRAKALETRRKNAANKKRGIE